MKTTMCGLANTAVKCGLFMVVTSLTATYKPAYSHDKWADGNEIPAWVKSSCCGPADAHHLIPEQVHRVKGGYKVDGYPEMVPEERALPSQDGDYWIFYNHGTYDGGQPWFSPVYCFFVPLSF
jgi:hypothetical protein